MFNKKARAAPAFFVSASQRRIAIRRTAARFEHAVRASCQHHPASAPQQGQADATLQQYLNKCTFATTCAMHRRFFLRLCRPNRPSRPSTKPHFPSTRGLTLMRSAAVIGDFYLDRFQQRLLAK
ncbi:hypothetical protein [Paraburkholderia jirisanensis]